MYRVWNFLTTYSLLLIMGALAALLWANLDLLFPVAGQPHFYIDIYHKMVDFVMWEDGLIGFMEDGVRILTPHYLVNELLMALFFAIAGKEVWEAVALKSGSLRGKKAVTPLIATLGGMLGPITVYLGIAYFLGSTTFDAVVNGWAVPTATDIAFSYLIGRMVFGAGHPAVRFLLLLAIADDAIGLVILAIFYPSGELAPLWLLVSVGAAVAVYVLANWLPRRLDRGNQARPNSTWMRQKASFWPYLLAGVISWYGFMRSGVNPALGLLFIVPTIPHAERAYGIFSAAQSHLKDLLNSMEHGLKHPVEVILFFFGLFNAGVQFSAIGEATWLVLAGLLIGKPLGIFIFGWIGARPLGFGLPDGMRMPDLFVLGSVAAIGFTVALFVATVAFEGGAVQDAAKMGALLSFSAAIVAIIAGKLLRVEKKPQ
ncbi:MAG: Na+/H+ antiporter NhaA [Rhodobacteraceae bacterium]|nr:Na+/H+ antiporter NhaA [Paracoccaceae bacterium]